MSDVYEQEIKRLVDLPAARVVWSWEEAGPLFRFATPTGEYCKRSDGKYCGCLTSIRRTVGTLGRVAWTAELTRQIGADERIPPGIYELTGRWATMTRDERAEILQPFAEWQRRLDKEIRNVRA